MRAARCSSLIAHRFVIVLIAIAVLCPIVRADPHADYMLHCQGCHGPAGEGAPGGIPSFHAVGRFLRLPAGRDYLLRVPGVAQSELSDARIAGVLNWMLHTFSADDLPPDAAPFSAAEVAQARRRTLIDVTAVRRALVNELGSRERQAATNN